jgi:ATP synthase protein I
MGQQSTPPASSDDEPSGDPWHAFGYVVSGVAVYGVLGWLADRWLGTSFLVAIGILVGAGIGIFMTWARFNRGVPGTGTPPPQPPQSDSTPHEPEQD